MVNHYEKPPFGRIFLELFPSIKQANLRKMAVNFLGVFFSFPECLGWILARKGFWAEKLFGWFFLRVWENFSGRCFGDESCHYFYLIWGGFIFSIFIPIPGKLIQFDEHIFQMGWNHQLVLYFMGDSDVSMKNRGAFLTSWCERKGKKKEPEVSEIPNRYGLRLFLSDSPRVSRNAHLSAGDFVLARLG